MADQVKLVSLFVLPFNSYIVMHNIYGWYLALGSVKQINNSNRVYSLCTLHMEFPTHSVLKPVHLLNFHTAVASPPTRPPTAASQTTAPSFSDGEYMKSSQSL